MSYSPTQKCFHHETLGDALKDNFNTIRAGGGSDYLPIFATIGDNFSEDDRKIIDKIYDVIRPNGSPHSDGGYPCEEEDGK